MDVKTLLEGCFINMDKPEGPTSHSVDEWVMKMLKVEKAGHFGTLDPMVTGVLPVAVGKATRLLQYLISGKEYVGTMHFHEDISLKKVKRAIDEKFLGTITQLPPVKSRVKRQEREREIYEFKILENSERDYLFYVKCEAGTYIRKLVHDLGEHLKIGAHMTELRRTKAGIFEEENSATLDEFARALEEFKEGKDGKLKAMLLPTEKVIADNIPMVNAKEDSVGRLKHGSPIFKQDLSGKEDISQFQRGESIAIFSKEKLIEVAEVVLEGEVFAKPLTVLAD